MQLNNLERLPAGIVERSMNFGGMVRVISASNRDQRINISRLLKNPEDFYGDSSVDQLFLFRDNFKALMPLACQVT